MTLDLTLILTFNVDWLYCFVSLLSEVLPLVQFSLSPKGHILFMAKRAYVNIKCERTNLKAPVFKSLLLLVVLEFEFFFFLLSCKYFLLCHPYLKEWKLQNFCLSSLKIGRKEKSWPMRLLAIDCRWLSKSIFLPS